MKLYVDEAGHTGKHLFDSTQPLFVYAGVWLDEETRRSGAIRRSDAARQDAVARTNTKGHTSGRVVAARRVVRCYLVAGTGEGVDSVSAASNACSLWAPESVRPPGKTK